MLAEEIENMMRALISLGLLAIVPNGILSSGAASRRVRKARISISPTSI